MTLVAIGASLLAVRQTVLANAAPAAAVTAQGEAEASARKIQILRLAAESAKLLAASEPVRALLAAAEATRRPVDDGENVSAAAASQLYNILGQTGGLPLSGHESGINTLAFSPEGPALVANLSGNVRVWNSATGLILGGTGGSTENPAPARASTSSGPVVSS